jgi:hypothetical protein
LYSKDEASQLKQEFWTTFGQYISPQLSADGLKVNWVNYKTGIKYLHFKMEAGKRWASIAIEITHQDIGIQELFFEQFKELKNIPSLIYRKIGNGNCIIRRKAVKPSAGYQGRYTV